MAFKLNVTANTQSGNGGVRKEVDWGALNNHVVEAAGTASKARSIPGYISGIIDLGEQEQNDAEVVFTGTAEDEVQIIKEFPNTYFKDGIDKQTRKPARLKCWPQRDMQQIAITVDFPQIEVDKSLYLTGNSNKSPLRVLYNGDFTLPGQKTKIVGRPFTIKEVKHPNGKWAFAKNSMLHKLAVATGVINEDELFTKDRVGELLGKVAQFQVRVWMKPGKNDMKFFTEDISLVGMVPEGVPVPELDEKYIYGVNLYGENDEEAVKQLRANVINTIKRAKNYEGSDIKAMIEAVEAARGGNRSSGDNEEQAEDKPQTQAAPKVEPVQTNVDDDIPF